jgi:hypothetical protein
MKHFAIGVPSRLSILIFTGDEDTEMTQLTLQQEYETPRIARPLVRDKDSLPAHRAADKAIKSGRVESEVRRVREYINRFCNTFQRPDFTAKGVAAWISEQDKIDYFPTYIMIQKRKSILKDRGFIEETDLPERDGCAVWIRKAK